MDNKLAPHRHKNTAMFFQLYLLVQPAFSTLTEACWFDKDRRSCSAEYFIFVMSGALSGSAKEPLRVRLLVSTFPACPGTAPVASCILCSDMTLSVYAAGGEKKKSLIEKDTHLAHACSRDLSIFTN